MSDDRRELLRALGPAQATAIVVGTVIGTGIFLKPRAIAEVLDSPGLILAVWVVGGVLSLLGALSYAELGEMFPHAGGEYVFMGEAYGRFGGLLWAWTYFVCAKIVSIAALAAGFAIFNFDQRRAAELELELAPFADRQLEPVAEQRAHDAAVGDQRDRIAGH